MSLDIISTPKNPGETKSYGVDFSPGIDTGDAVSTYDVDVFEATTDTDKTADMLVIASPNINGSVVTARFKEGTDGTRYNLRFAVTTNFGETLYHFRVLTVKDERK